MRNNVDVCAFAVSTHVTNFCNRQIHQDNKPQQGLQIPKPTCNHAGFQRHGAPLSCMRLLHTRARLSHSSKQSCPCFASSSQLAQIESSNCPHSVWKVVSLALSLFESPSSLSHLHPKGQEKIDQPREDSVLVERSNRRTKTSKQVSPDQSVA